MPPAAPLQNVPLQKHDATRIEDDIGSRQDSRTMLLDAAERQFALNGIEGVSLREIAMGAGQRNNSAVHYHFGDKQGLVDTLLADRFSKIDGLRKRNIDKAGDLTDRSTEDLLHLMWQPLLDIDVGRGGHWFIRFQLACHLQNSQSIHPVGRDPLNYPASHQFMETLRQKFDHLLPDQFYYRLSLMALMYWSAVCWHDKIAITSLQHWSSRFSLDETVKMTAAALAAPA
jgi:AcrR family transcriptional regulator